uniref:Uncharacterized protein n=1 Tax=Panagrolaimus sp. PS1159 TaxID=55785 RepID=A0AC35GMA7_9BILA
MKKLGHTLRLVFKDENNTETDHETIPLNENQNAGGPFNSHRTRTSDGTNASVGTPESNFTTTILPSKLRKLQLLSVKVDNDNSGIRYRKARNKIGGNEKDHWKEENLIHMVSLL